MSKIELRNVEDLLGEYFTQEEIDKSRQRAKRFSDSLDQTREYISNFIKNYMENNNVGFNEMTRMLRSNATQLQKIRKGNANLTISSLAEIAASLGCELEVKFKPQRKYEKAEKGEKVTTKRYKLRLSAS